MLLSSTAALSPEFRRFCPVFTVAGGRILDVPSGRGRHALALMQMGCAVTCVDVNHAALQSLKRASRRAGLEKAVTVYQHDVVQEPWPFPKEIFFGAVNVHFYHAGLLDKVAYSLVRGGLLYLETVANRGGQLCRTARAG